MHIRPIKMRWLTGGVNYSYLVSNQDKTKSWLIDPAEPLEVLSTIGIPEQRSVVAIVNTHHHYDHSQGNQIMLKALKGLIGNGVDIPVIAGSEKSPHATIIPRHHETFSLGDTINVLCIRTPCHTQDSICYYLHDKATDEHALFTGDTLFTGGCGRFFEGTAEEMDTALNETLVGSIPKEFQRSTKVFPGHEYTKSNVEFIRKKVYTEPGVNKAFDSLEKFANTNEMTTGQFSIMDETEYNPFMRLDDPIVRASVGDHQAQWASSQVMNKLRQLKNSM